MTRVEHDARSIVRARGAVNDARNHTAAASSRAHATRDGQLADVLIGLEAIDVELVAVWDALAYVDAELAAYLGDD